MSIIIGADIVPTERNSSYFEKENIEYLVGSDLIQIFKDTDYRVFNLETPLTNDVAPIDKCGPALRADCSTILGIKKLGVDLFTLANNHIMDQGETGLTSTINLLKKNEISYLGAGENLEQARKPFVKNIKGKRIGFYACAEHEFSIASENNAGGNPFDALESFDHVVALKAECDFVVVLYHGGKEYYQYPSPMLQKVCRKFVEKGADLVVCQHSHCIGCEEKYAEGTIVYGQGNFLFDDCVNPFAEHSLLIKIEDDFSINYLPLVKFENGVRLATGDDAEKIIDAFKIRSEQIKEDGFILKEFAKFAPSMLQNYLIVCSGFRHRIICRILNRLTHGRIVKKLTSAYSKDELLALRNFIECEAHRELWIEGLLKK
ncbi:CapA family protein [Fibrobacter sp. UWB11]|uniref:CapA family protein n=1 Tax=Fibrobacter sp. UWB11 TaxID=1896202 RepID=UPI0009264BF4|nr:CapA family protein [Fibrobacter sp. UWB11]SIN97136.1 poly-gamma-glutamate synthesis protein (capsule biosynthesis protein) [Fibrobacter sp. UWB11]